MPERDAALVLQDLIYGGLELLKTAAGADLCAYLHTSDDHGPQLYLAAPELGATDPAEAFTLFTALRDALDDDHEGDEAFLISSYVAVAITTAGPGSRGLHVVGRLDEPLEPDARETVARMARAIGALVHAWQAPPQPAQMAQAPGRIQRVAVETADGRAHAEVTAAVGDELRTGVGEAPSAAHAVAQAVLELLGRDLKLADASDGDIGGERVALVLVIDGLERRAVGSGLVTETTDLLRATAHATLEAALRLGT